MEPKICCRMRGRSARVLSLRRDTRMVHSGYREWHSRAKNLQIRESASGTKLGGGKEAPEIRERTGQAALRARAILSLLAIYGLRSGEVSRLMLSDIDWREEVFVVNHSKRGGPQPYPLQRQVGDAILQYLKGGRPRCSCRHLFVTLTPPYRPLSTSALWALTSKRLRAAGIQCQRRGPHVLRHARATRLLHMGASLKEIGDLLGHRSLESVGIYAKVDVPALRAVAAVDLGGLA